MLTPRGRGKREREATVHRRHFDRLNSGRAIFFCIFSMVIGFIEDSMRVLTLIKLLHPRPRAHVAGGPMRNAHASGAVFSSTYLPELGTNLVAALAGLEMNNFSHC